MKRIIFMMAIFLLLTGCGELTHEDCLSDGKFKAGERCEDWNDMTISERKVMLTELAEKRAELKGISEEEAMFEIMAIFEGAKE